VNRARAMLGIDAELQHLGWRPLRDQPTWIHPQLDYWLEVREDEYETLRLMVWPDESLARFGARFGAVHSVTFDEHVIANVRRAVQWCARSLDKRISEEGRP
jgi:hypothetical protein